MQAAHLVILFCLSGVKSDVSCLHRGGGGSIKCSAGAGAARGRASSNQRDAKGVTQSAGQR